MAEVTPTPREGVITRIDVFTDAGVRIEVTPTPREGVITRFTVPRRNGWAVGRLAW